MCGPAEISPSSGGGREYSIGATKLFFGLTLAGFAATVAEDPIKHPSQRKNFHKTKRHRVGSMLSKLKPEKETFDVG